MHFDVNTRKADIGFTSLATSAVSGTYTQCPSQVCDQVVIYVPGANAVTVAGSATPAGALLQLAGGSVTNLQTGGNLNGLWIAPTTAASVTVGFQWLRFRPYR